MRLAVYGAVDDIVGPARETQNEIVFGSKIVSIFDKKDYVCNWAT